MSRARYLADLLGSDNFIRASRFTGVAWSDLSNVASLPTTVQTQLVGADGADGATGPQGPQGVPGNDGATGPQGPTGPQGFNTSASEGHYKNTNGTIHMYASGAWRQIYPAVYS